MLNLILSLFKIFLADKSLNTFGQWIRFFICHFFWIFWTYLFMACLLVSPAQRLITMSAMKKHFILGMFCIDVTFKSLSLSKTWAAHLAGIWLFSFMNYINMTSQGTFLTEFNITRYTSENLFDFQGSFFWSRSILGLIVIN